MHHTKTLALMRQGKFGRIQPETSVYLIYKGLNCDLGLFMPKITFAFSTLPWYGAGMGHSLVRALRRHESKE